MRLITASTTWSGASAEDKKEDMRKLLIRRRTASRLTQSLKTRKTIERLTDIAKNTRKSGKETKEEEK